MNEQCRLHARVSELPVGVRRRCVQIAVALTALSFGAFLLFVVIWTGSDPPGSDSQALWTFGLLSLAQGMAYGIHSRLTRKQADAEEFVDQPGWIDYTILTLSPLLLIAGTGVGAAALR